MATRQKQKSELSPLVGYLLVCGFFLIAPLFVWGNIFLINKWALYVSLAIVAMALSLSWGYAGILNLGQAASFGLGAYAIAMHLKLVASKTAAGGLPDFMVWNSVHTLPWFWIPFYSLTAAIVLGLTVPVLLAIIFGWFIFRARVSGVYVAIMLLALLVVINLIVITEQPYTGGWNGITNLPDLYLFGYDIGSYSYSFYYLVAGTACAFLLGGYAVVHTKTGLMLRALRENRDRARFLGYDVAMYEIFAFSLSAGVAAVAGMFYAVGNSFASPTYMDIPISLGIVIWCAVGGRSSLAAAALGAWLVNAAEGTLGSELLDVANLVVGGLFVVIVLFAPNGIVLQIGRWLAKRIVTIFGKFDGAGGSGQPPPANAGGGERSSIPSNAPSVAHSEAATHVERAMESDVAHSGLGGREMDSTHVP